MIEQRQRGATGNAPAQLLFQYGVINALEILGDVGLEHEDTSMLALDLAQHRLGSIRAAVRSALSQKLTDQEIIVVDKFEMAAPKTKELLAALKSLGVTKGLLVLPGHDDAVERSARNMENVKTLFATYLNIRDIFTYDQLVVSLDALNKIQEWLG